MSVIVADVQDAAHLYDVKNDSEVVNEAHVFVELNNADYQDVANLFSDAEDETNVADYALVLACHNKKLNITM